MVCDECNHRVQVFELSGTFVAKFVSKGSERNNLAYEYIRLSSLLVVRDLLRETSLPRNFLLDIGA